jgi:ceramide glucosyltransferase
MDMLLVLSLGFSILLCGLCFGSIWFYRSVILSSIDYLTQADPIPPLNFQPPVTVLQSLTDSPTLDCFCQQDYAPCQIIFAAPKTHRTAVEQVQQLQQRYPDRDISLVTAESESAAWAKAAAAAKFQLLVFADGQTRVAANYLQQLLQPFRYPSVGAVTSFYRCRGRHSWITNLSLLTDLYPAALIARCRVGVHFTLNTNLAIRKSLLTQLQFDSSEGFWIPSGRADRAQLGYGPGSLGYRTVLSHQVVERVVEPACLGSLWHTLNYNQALSHSLQVAPWKAIRLMQYGTVFSLLLLIGLGGSPLGWTLIGLTWATRWGMAWTIGLGCLKDRAIWQYGWLLPLYDWVSLGLWGYQLVQRLGRQALASSQPLPLELAQPRFSSPLPETLAKPQPVYPPSSLP